MECLKISCMQVTIDWTDLNTCTSALSPAPTPDPTPTLGTLFPIPSLLALQRHKNASTCQYKSNEEIIVLYMGIHFFQCVLYSCHSAWWFFFTTLSGISGLSFDSLLTFALWFFCPILLLFPSPHFSANGPFAWLFWENSQMPFIESWELGLSKNLFKTGWRNSGFINKPSSLLFMASHHVAKVELVCLAICPSAGSLLSKVRTVGDAQALMVRWYSSIAFLFHFFPLSSSPWPETKQVWVTVEHWLPQVYKLGSPLLRTRSWQIFLLKPGVSWNIALYAFPPENFPLFLLSWPIHLHFL